MAVSHWHRLRDNEADLFKLVVLDDYQNWISKVDFSAIQGHVQVQSIKEHLESESLFDLLQDCDILVAMRERTVLSKDFLSRLPRLVLLITTGMRNDAIDPPDSVVFCGTRILPHPVVELTWALILGLSRSLVAENQSLVTGGWQLGVGSSLRGKTLGLLGLGNSGSAVASVGKAFGMEVVAWSPNLDIEHAGRLGVAAKSKLEVMNSDVVSVHMRLSERSQRLIGESEIGAMKSSSLFINTSRAQIVDTNALASALKLGKIAGAGLDVFDVEPIEPGNPLLDSPNVLLTPHIGYVVRENYEIFFADVIENVERFLSGNPVRVIDTK
jgi:phosphoglycerate dehydrogenase-like enzyme